MEIIFDIITAGSATVDVFVKTHVSDIPASKKHKEMIAYPLGDKILVEDLHQEIGGGATNTAVAFSRMGLKTAYLGVLGKDENAELVLQNLEKENIKFIGKHKDCKTNYSVILDSQLDDRTILVFKDASEKLFPKDLPEITSRWLYMSSLSLKTMESLSKKAKNSEVTVVFNPSSYTAKMGLNKLKKVLKSTDILIFNRDEARVLLNTKDDELHLLMELKKYVEIPVITNGSKGVWALKDDKVYHLLPKKNIHVVETTGAGDAFASGFVSGLMLMKGVKDALLLGMLNSEAVISHIGAKNILLDKDHAIKLLKRDKREIHEITLK